MKISAGILLCRKAPENQFLLVHPGGPFWARKDEHAWSIPKGAPSTGSGSPEIEEALEETARREFMEETGMRFDDSLTPLPPVKLSSGKIIHPFLGKGDFDPDLLRSNVFEMEWPPKSGRLQSFPEVDKAGWFDPETAKLKIHKGQVGIIESALDMLQGGGEGN